MEDGETGNGEEEDRRKGGQGTKRGSRRSNRDELFFVISWLQMNVLGW